MLYRGQLTDLGIVVILALRKFTARRRHTMPLPVITNGFRTRSVFSNVVAGRPWSTGMDFLCSTGGGDAQALADELIVRWNLFFITTSGGTAPQTLFRTEINLQSVEVYELDGSTAPATATPVGVVGGTNASSAGMPPDLAVVVSKRTAQRGARGRGRSYLAGFAGSILSTVDQGFIANGAAAALENNWVSQFDSVTAGGQTYDQVVIGRIGVGSPIQAAFPITNYSVDNSFDVQRRRGLA